MPITGTLTSYATVADLGDYLKDVSQTANNIVWTKILARASRFIDHQTDSYFGQSAGTFVFSGNNSSRLFMSYPIVSVSSLQAAYYTGAPLNTISSGQYFLQPEQPSPGEPYQWIQLTNIPTSGQSTRFFNGWQTVSVTGVFGWPAVPDDIAHLTCKIAARWWKARDSGWTGVIGSIDTGLMTVKTIDQEDRMILSYYSNPGIGDLTLNAW